ncbi:MAG: hypothetical protein M3O28_02475 [Actinomycetota bacterium]|nr:hypothetical protein [Actinomycetota bacterium]
MRFRGPRSARRCLTALAALAALGGTFLITTADPTGAQAPVETYLIPPSGTVTVQGHGNGHGHGMSQYGARGAAIAGHSAAYIAGFYYPGTTLVTLPAATVVRVLISGAGSSTEVTAATGMRVTGVSRALPTAGIGRYRLVAGTGSSLTLQKLVGAAWTTSDTGLPSGAQFSRPDGTVRVYLPDGSSTMYRGTIAGVRSGTSVLTINHVLLDSYAMGVAPREMPASWQAAAVQAQAIAARSYGEFEREHAGAGSAWDICDSDQCQVYGGMTHYDAAGNVLWNDDPAAVSGNALQVIAYHGATAFTQFSASDGGWTVDGGQPYLLAKQDDFDNAGTGDPWLNWTEPVPVSQIARSYGLARVTAIQITARDGHGQWGGRVLSANVVGTGVNGRSASVATTGFGLQSAMGLPHNWFTIDNLAASAPTRVTATAADASITLTWSPPTNAGASPITGYTVSLGARTLSLPASARATTLIGLINGRAAFVAVRAITSYGAGTAATASATPNAAPQRIKVVAPLRLFDTRAPAVAVTASHPFSFAFAGKGAIPSTAGAAVAVQLALTVTHATLAGVLHVQTSGAPVGVTAAIAYRPGASVTTMVSVPITPTSTVTFQPSTGSVVLIADQMSYSGPGLSSMASVVPRRLASIPHLQTGAGTVIRVTGGAVPTDATGVVLGIAASPANASGWIAAWADGAPIPTVSQDSVSRDGSGASTVIVPVGTNGQVRLAASSTAIGAQVTLLGYLAPPAAGRGSVETFQATPISDGPAGAGPSLFVSAIPAPLVILGQAQLPHQHVQAVLVQITVTGASRAGLLYAFAGGAAQPTAPSATFPQGASSTTTVLVQVGMGGAFQVTTNGPSATAAVDVIGWVTAG